MLSPYLSSSSVSQLISVRALKVQQQTGLLQVQSGGIKSNLCLTLKVTLLQVLLSSLPL